MSNANPKLTITVQIPIGVFATLAEIQAMTGELPHLPKYGPTINNSLITYLEMLQVEPMSLESSFEFLSTHNFDMTTLTS